MGNTFSVGSFYRGHPIPSEWNGTPEEYEALKALMIENMGNNNELYQILYGINRIIKGPEFKTTSKEFFEHGFVNLIIEVIKKKRLNDDLLSVAFSNLGCLAEGSGYGLEMVNTYGCLKLMADALHHRLDSSASMNACMCITALSYYWRSDADVDIEYFYTQVLQMISKHKDSVSMCLFLIDAIYFTLYNGKDKSIPKFLKVGGVEKVCELFRENTGNNKVLSDCSWVFVALSRIREGAYDVMQMGGMELLISSMKIMRDMDALRSGFCAIGSLASAEPSTCVRALDLGVLDVIRSAVVFPEANKAFLKTTIICLTTLFAVDVTFKSERHKEAKAIANTIKSRFPLSKGIQKYVNLLNRVEDPKARECREAHICTRMGIGDCLNHPSTQQCKKCYVPQFFFRCLTCSSNVGVVYCLSCKERCHKGHKGVTYFTIGRCDCENPECCKPPSSSPSNAPVDEDDDWVFV